MDPLKELMDSLAKLEFGGMSAEEKDEDITKQLAGHYLALIRAFAPPYTRLSIDKEDFTKVTLDGILYDLTERFSLEDPHLAPISEILSQLSEDGENIEDLLLEVTDILNT